MNEFKEKIEIERNQVVVMIMGERMQKIRIIETNKVKSGVKNNFLMREHNLSVIFVVIFHLFTFIVRRDKRGRGINN